MKSVLDIVLIFIIIVGLCLFTRYTGYRYAEKKFLESCIKYNELVIDDIKFACIKCSSSKKEE